MDFDIAHFSLTVVIIIFAFSALVIAIAGTFLTKYADVIADRTKLGEALVGAVLLGAVTSLAGVITSITAAANGYPALAVSNAIGGIAAQTAFLAIADITYKRSNLEHAAASLSNLLYSVLLTGLLAFLLVMMLAPEFTLAGVHPFSPIIFVAYILGLRIVSKAKRDPMWKPTLTKRTVLDEPQQEHEHVNMKKVWSRFAICALLVSAAGYCVAEASIEISERTALSETFVGTVFTAVVTSLPELIVSISAVRQGAITMAVGNIVGGNSFEVIVVALADFFYRDGSLLHSTSEGDQFVVGLTLLLMCVLTMGLIYRQQDGIGKIGWESFLIIVFFLAGYYVLYLMN